MLNLESRKFLFLIGFFLISSVLQASDEPLELRTKEKSQGNGVDLIFKNHSKVPYTVNLKVRGSNISTRCTAGCLIELAAGQHKLVDTITTKSAQRSWRYNTEYFYSVGAVAQDYDQDYVYLPPFAHGEKFPLEQAFNGSFSHKGLAQYAIDFTMPEGTAVHAARDGEVIKVVQHYSRGGISWSMKDKANHILILHSDGTMGEYAHLHQNGVLVKVGDQVQRGQQIALSGNTGYSSGPHLHFAVMTVNEKAQQQSLPFLLKGRRGLAETPQQQYYYSLHEGQPPVPEVYADEMDFLEYFTHKSPVTDLHALKDRVEFMDDHVLIYIQNGLRSPIEMDFNLNISGFESLRSESGKQTIAAKTEQLIAVLRPAGDTRQRRYSYKYRYRELR